MLLFKKPAVQLRQKQQQCVLRSCTLLMVLTVHSFPFNLWRTFLNKSGRPSVKWKRQHTLFLAFHVTRQTGEGLLMASGRQSVPSASRQVEGHCFRLCTAVREFLGNIQVCEAIGSPSHYQSIQCALMAIKEGQWQIASLQCWHWPQRFPLLAWEGGWCLCVFNMRSPIYPHVFLLPKQKYLRSESLQEYRLSVQDIVTIYRIYWDFSTYWPHPRVQETSQQRMTDKQESQWVWDKGVKHPPPSDYLDWKKGGLGWGIAENKTCN